MCVIVTGSTEKPTLEDLESMEVSNSHGNGIAWAQQGVIHYEKGITLERLDLLLRQAPSHWVIHFRIQTAGGSLPELCHPFPIDKAAPLDLKGTAQEVLFHNGHINDWENLTLKGICKKRTGITVPIGPWSDSRAMAWLIATVGRNVLSFAGLTNKFALLSVDGIRHYPKDQSGWTARGGYMCSNTHWVGRTPRTRTSYGTCWQNGKEDNRPFGFRNNDNDTLTLIGD